MKLALLGLLLVTAWSYAGVRSAPWVYEDANFVTENPAVLGHEPVQIGRARWLANLLNRVQWVWTPSARAFHLTNLALHLVNGVLVVGVASAYLGPWGAWLTSAIFLLHPIQSEAVAYVSGRTELLAAAFVLLAWLLPTRRWWQHGLVWLLIVCAISCKESAVVSVPLLLLRAQRDGRRVSWWLLCALLVPIAALAGSVLRFDHTTTSSLPPLAYAATQAAALARYLALVIVPWGFTVDHDFELVAWGWRWLALGVVGTLLALGLLLSASVSDETRTVRPLWRALHPRLGLVVLGGLWTLLALSPRFVMRIPEALNEHQLYLPVVGISLAIAGLLAPTETPA